MNSLTATLEESAVEKTTRIRLLQVVTFMLAILGFMQIILMLRRQLSRASKHHNALTAPPNRLLTASLSRISGT